MANELHFYNNYHLGDMGYHLHFCNKLLLHNRDLTIYNYTKEKYITELDKHIYPDNAGLMFNKPLSEKSDNAQNCWINRNWEYEQWKNNIFYFDNFDVFYVDFYNTLFGEMGYNSPVKSVDDFLFDHPVIEEFSNEVEEYDFLIINSKPYSGQWQFKENDFDQLIKRIKDSGYSVITTKETAVPNTPCTLDKDYSLLQIASQATKIKYVIGIHTSPWLYTYNKYSLDNIELFICLQNQGVTYSSDKVFSLKDNFSEIYKILSNKGINI